MEAKMYPVQISGGIRTGTQPNGQPWTSVPLRGSYEFYLPLLSLGGATYFALRR